jgi:hypothetical protein|tara:strand:- start:122 stop:574 length:453 start_codon:yes stop_codon:yes gene_type:complete
MEWHAYKVFKNGKRAKAPVKSFAYEGSNVSAIEHFEANIKKNFNEKNRGLNYILLRGDQPQERAVEKSNQQADEDLKNQTRILARFLAKAHVKSKYRVVGGLIFAKATDWKWQWCALECATNNYIAGLSPLFDSHREAQEWMNQQIQNLK